MTKAPLVVVGLDAVIASLELSCPPRPTRTHVRLFFFFYASSVEDGEARCKCMAGYRDVPGIGCMDDSAPTLKLKGPATMTMKQCDKYVESGVEVVDANSENDDR